jgi:hypothetical protein
LGLERNFILFFRVGIENILILQGDGEMERKENVLHKNYSFLVYVHSLGSWKTFFLSLSLSLSQI